MYKLDFDFLISKLGFGKHNTLINLVTHNQLTPQLSFYLLYTRYNSVCYIYVKQLKSDLC